MAKMQKIQTIGKQSLSTSGKSTVDGVPVQMFKKDIIYEGYFIHPLTLQEINVPRERIDKWASTFQQMKANGVDVELKCDHSYSAKDIVGYARDMFAEEVDGIYTLFAVFEVKGDEGIKLAATVKNVSIESQVLIDGKGIDYGDAITGVAICQQPVIPGQKEFQKLEASCGGAGAIPYIPKQELKMTISKEVIDKITAIVGDGTAVTEENALELLLSKVADLTTAKTELESKVAELSAKAVQPKEGDTAMDGDTAEVVAMSMVDRVDLLLEQGKITKKQHELVLSLIGTEGKRNTLYLSAKKGVAGKSVASSVIDILKEGQSITGTKTGVQTLSHAVASKDEKPFDAEAAAKSLLKETGYSVKE